MKYQYNRAKPSQKLEKINIKTIFLTLIGRKEII